MNSQGLLATSNIYRVIDATVGMCSYIRIERISPSTRSQGLNESKSIEKYTMCLRPNSCLVFWLV